MKFTNNQELIRTLFVEALVSSGLILISLRSYLFGNGFFDYADQYWVPSLYSPHLVYLCATYYNSYVGVLGYTRSSIAGIGIILSYLFRSPIIQEKVFILYTFIIFLTFSYILATILYKVLVEKLSLQLTFLKQEIFKAFLVIAIYSNIAIINLNVDGGTWSDGLIMVFIAIVVSYSVYTRSWVKATGVMALFLSLSIFLDPDYYLGFVVVIFVSSLFVKRSRFYERLLTPAVATVLSLPVLIYILDGLIITSAGITNPLAERPIVTVFGLAHLNLITSILLVGHFWSTYAISPPSIFFMAGKNTIVPYFGDIVLLPPSWLTYVWILTLSLYPIIALLSLFIKRTAKISLPFGITWLASFVLSIWWKIPLISNALFYLANLSFIGPAIGTTLSLGGHYMNIEGVSETVLIGILMFNILYGKPSFYPWFKRFGYIVFTGVSISFVIDSWFTIYSITGIVLERSYLISLVMILTLFLSLYLERNTIRKIFERLRKTIRLSSTNKFFKYVTAIAIVTIVVMTGWQAFNGSFYPQRSFSGSSRGILSTSDGPYSPVFIPNYVIDSFDNYTANSTYETVFYAPQMPNNFDGEYEGGYLSYLINNNYSSFISAFLDAENIRYIITYEDSSEITNALNSSGLYHFVIGPGAYVYENFKEKGNYYNANLMLNYSGPTLRYLLAYKIFGSLNVTPVFSESANKSIGFNSYSDTVNVLSPLYLASNYKYGTFVNSSYAFSRNVTEYFLPLRNNYISTGWYVYTGQNNVSFKIGGGTLFWNVQRNTSIDINYGNATGPGYYTVIPIPNYKHLFTSAKITPIIAVR